MSSKEIAKTTNKETKLPEKSKENFRGLKCLNCGHPIKLTDKFCANCSQKNSTKQLSISDFFNEFFSSLFTYDSRLRFTVKDLLFKPGVITKNYVAGQRLKYANPFRFYLSVSIIFFILQGFSSDDSSSLSEKDKDSFNEMIISSSKPEQNSKNIYFNSDSLQQEIDSIVQESSSLKEKRKDTITSYLSEAELDTIGWSNRLVERISMYRGFYNETKIKNPSKALDSLHHKQTRLNKWLYNKNDAIDRVLENPSDFFNYLMKKIPFFLFFFAPIYAFFFWILYSMKKYNYMEHLIFIFHIFSFVFLVGVLAYFPDLLLGNEAYIASILIFIVGPFYFYKALRNFYQQNRWLTIFKFIILNIVFFIGTLITATLFFTATAAIF